MRNVQFFTGDLGEEKSINDLSGQKGITIPHLAADPSSAASGKENILVTLLALLTLQNAPLGCPVDTSCSHIPCALTPNFAEGCPGLFRVQEEREAFLGKETTPK